MIPLVEVNEDITRLSQSVYSKKWSDSVTESVSLPFNNILYQRNVII